MFQRLKITVFITMLALHSWSLNAASVITLDENTGIVTIRPDGETSSQVLKALSVKTGFILVGELETQQVPLNNQLRNSIQGLIDSLVRLQSVAIVYSRDAKGKKYIRKVELLPTGNENTKYILNAEDGARPLVGSQDQIEKRIAHNERRAKRRTQRIAEGTLVWSPEGRKKLTEQNKIKQ